MKEDSELPLGKNTQENLADQVSADIAPCTRAVLISILGDVTCVKSLRSSCMGQYPQKVSLEAGLFILRRAYPSQCGPC